MAARDAGERAARVIVLATGGTIASAATDGGGAVAQRTAAELLKAAGPAGVDVQANDLMKVGSYLMTHRDMRTIAAAVAAEVAREDVQDRKSTRLNSSHVAISYAVFCLKKKK